ncbi:class III lanthionine synthetase LanKC [Streptomyces abikoensis]|uniref:class III lanthionine synthetase LanKC n=1 Tax=Streptomyces abikoensis TaxID=97398 RepID=UPI00167A1E47|nr:class III lanthionine synthetase LanKC [Streptomyces abikoensis]GGP45853.1 serine/threonine protein kinase [Streptomyces abikoensis]
MLTPKAVLTLKDYDRFCLADPVFYEVPERYPDDHDRFAAARREPPRGWERGESGWWITLRPGPAEPEAGWRIHVSVALPELARAVEIVWGHCVAHALPFDFVRSRATARELCGDRAEPLPGNRLITVHAGDGATLTRSLEELGVLLAGLPGPYVAGALRHGPGPLYVSHGPPGPEGRPRPGDRTVFAPPDGVPLPEPLRADLEALRARPAGGFPYRAERALGRSHGGGTYLAVDKRTGERVVLREARPHAGIDERGEDAVTRLDRERAARERLVGLDCVPRVLAHLTHAEHRFLAEEFIEGTSLLRAAADTFPLTSRERAAREAAPYTAWALDVVDRTERALHALYAHGLRLGELRPENVVVRPDGRVVLVGLGTLTDAGDDRAPATGDPGFAAPPGLTAPDALRHLLDRLRLWLFLPVPHRGPGKLHTLTAAIERHYPVPRGFGAGLLTGLWPRGHPAEDDRAGALLAADRPDWPAIRDSLVRGIHATATPDRPDRLFPGSPTGAGALGGPGLAHGAAGVLYALHRVGARVPEEYTAWLLDAVRRDPGPAPGLHEGLHGVAFVLDALGLRAEALDVLGRCPPERDAVPDAGLAAGRAGIALTLLHFATATGDPALLARALGLAGALGRAVEDGPPPAPPGHPAPYGLLHGATGAALLFLRLYEHTGDASLLGLAGRALRHDLVRLRALPDGMLTLFDGTANLPYLHGGSTGLAFVLRDLLRYRPDPRLAAVLTSLRLTCDAVYVRNAGLLRGRAGSVAVLAALGEPVTGTALGGQIRRLSWYAQTYRGHLAFPGFRMLRLSADLATGAAGVLLALGSAFAATGPVLPFLDPRPVAVPPAREGGERRVGDPGAAGAGGGDPRPVAV